MDSHRLNRFALSLRSHAHRWAAQVTLPVALVTLFIAVERTQAEPPGWELVRPEPGGLIPRPLITSVSASDQAATIQWTGFLAPYQVEQSTNLASGSWQVIATNLTNLSLTVPGHGSMGVLRVQGPVRPYLSASNATLTLQCGLCHPDNYAEWTQTHHAGALGTLKNAGQSTNQSCLVCHVVGLGLDTGYKDEATTPGLAGVQCENCHGPAGPTGPDGRAHPELPTSNTKHPVVTLSAKLCGGCHDGIHHPTYTEWTTTLHAEVVPDVSSGFFTTNGAARMLSCGPCHSGAIRNALVKNAEEGGVAEDLELPTASEAAEIGVTCVVCHDPHAEAGNGLQLRYPMASLIPYSYNTAASTTFAAQYNPQVNVCGQCHNARGAAWTDTSRPPHHSPQYNILIGNSGVESTNVAPVVPQSPHRNITNQCATCHMQAETPETVNEATPVYTGHQFQVKTTACAPCHDEEEATLFMNGTQTYTQTRIGEIKTLLDQWATTKAPDALRSKYGALAWEYTTFGELSTPPATVTSGPSAKEQAAVPDGIKQARYNLYLVFHDGSLGVHNGRYTRYLLDVAAAKVQALLGQ